MGMTRKGCRSRFVSDTRGTTAIEFAFVALPLFALLFGIFELALVYMVTTTLENATYAAGRTIRTGELQSEKGDATTFRKKICDDLSWLGSACATHLYVNVETLTAFNKPDLKPPMKDGKFDETSLKFEPGEEGDIVMVRSYYRWALFTPFLKGGMQTTSAGEAIFTSAATFRNEPYK